jgi:AbrB family looped-hinge helix DNA binding protein
MREFEATVTGKGQITIPKEIRRIMGLHPHDRVSFELEGESVKIRRVSSKLMQGYGAITARKKPEEYQELRKAFEAGVAEELIQNSTKRKHE